MKLQIVGPETVLSRLRFDWRSVATCAVFAALIIGVFLPYYSFAPVRVGDGSEYYGMFIAIKDVHRLWMTPRAFELYDAFVSTRSIADMVSAQALYDMFPQLHLGTAADFNHFWIYSLLASIVARVGDILGLTPSAHHAFVTLHLLLTLGVVWLAQVLFGWRGAAAATVLSLLSPMVWYFDKVHTEHFTFCMTLAAVMLTQRRHLSLSAACLALVSTQNPSFAIVALAQLVWRVATIHRTPIRLWELCAIVATVLFALLHPAYYYFRHGVLTPQLLAGGAKLGTNIGSFSLWLLDPDLGLLPNWPMGLVLILIGLGLLVAGRRHMRVDWPLMLFVAGFAAVNLIAQSSTTTINSGATPGLSRYALWYIPLFFPLALQSVTWLSSRALPVKVLSVATVVAYVVLNAWVYDPRSGEDYTHPTSVSKFVQTYLPGLYNPPVEVFMGRFADPAETTTSRKTLAILGPSCDKLLIIPGPDHSAIANPTKCLVDHDKIETFAKELSFKNAQARYIRLGSKSSDFAISTDRTYATSLGNTGGNMLGAGWHKAEEWGVWAATQVADLNIPCPRDLGAFRVALTLVAFNEDRDSKIVIANQALWAGKVTRSSPTEVAVVVGPNRCVGGVARLTIAAESMDAPKALGISNDERALGIGLIKIDYLR